ncbi:THAP domain-containing protein 1-like [Pseudomyrmex gracilis]|uniref:THAP domain-containing protein 1-like n=1 Tax=Pseudomyrmex gracilis TaxID=219809 RepID=UPI000994A27F|nr:THAP domain-containing protein 1-like [Pseudomyrmex gracilis]
MKKLRLAGYPVSVMTTYNKMAAVNMPSCCCVPQCKNITKDEFHLFRFPLNRPDILQLWIAAIGRDDFKPTKYSLICSLHFQENDFMKRPNASGVRLNNLAVPSIFCAPISADVTASAIETPSIEFNTTLASTSAVVPEIKWKSSILKPKEDNSKENTSTPNTTIKIHMHKSRTIMNNSSTINNYDLSKIFNNKTIF